MTRTILPGAAPAFLMLLVALGAPARAGAQAADGPAVAAAPDALLQDCPTCPVLVRLPPGTVVLGSPPDAPHRDPDEGPQRTVRIPAGLAIGRFEVTRAQYGRFVEATGHPGGRCYVDRGEGADDWGFAEDGGWDKPYLPQGPDHPVTCVGWADAVAYADWLSTETGHSYRLPSEAEWAYAARARGPTLPDATAPGSDICAHANVADLTAATTYPHWSVADCRDGAVFTAPVGSYRPNGFGLYDMIGNVWEWVADCYHDSLTGIPGDGRPWRDDACAQGHVLRGASWLDRPRYVRLSNRIDDAHRGSIFGFRVVREDAAPDAATEATAPR